MKQRAHHARLRLIVTADIPTPCQRRKPKQKARQTNPRALLLNTLREQRARIGSRQFERADAPELFDLSIAADRAPHGKRSFVFQGVRFRLKFGFRRYVIDPATGEMLTGGRFLA